MIYQNNLPMTKFHSAATLQESHIRHIHIYTKNVENISHSLIEMADQFTWLQWLKKSIGSRTLTGDVLGVCTQCYLALVLVLVLWMESDKCHLFKECGVTEGEHGVILLTRVYEYFM
jgi:hypothetical protein